MADIYQEIKELKEKIEFCSYAMKYGKMLDMSSDQTVKAFKVKGELEDELRFMELKKQMTEIAASKGKQAMIILTPIEGTK